MAHIQSSTSRQWELQKTGSLGSIREQKPPVNTAGADNDESLSGDTFGSGPQLWTAEAREKGYGRHQAVSTADIQVVGLTFEDSKK